jgi:hypothetical protein
MVDYRTIGLAVRSPMHSAIREVQAGGIANRSGIAAELSARKLAARRHAEGYHRRLNSAMVRTLADPAVRATRGDYFEYGKQLEKRRRKDVRMNTGVRRVRERKPK